MQRSNAFGLLAAITVAGVSVGCRPPSSPSGECVLTALVLVGPNTVATGSTIEMGYSALGNDACLSLSSNAAQWSNSNPAVATMTEVLTLSGQKVANVTGVSPGTTRVTLTFANITRFQDVTVTGAPPAMLSTILLSPPTNSLAVLGTVNLTPTCRNAAGTDITCPSAPTWNSSAPTIASVSGGSVTALAPGTATITATIGSVSGQATVTVLPPTPVSCDVGLALEDGFDDAMATSRWTAMYYDPFTDGTFSRAEAHSPGGGNLDGFRRMTHTLGFPAGPSLVSSIWVGHFYTASTYTPSSSGSIARLVYREDQRVFTPILVSWTFALRQNGQIFFARPSGSTPITSNSWTSVGPYDITPASFGVNRPDFSGTGGPIEFGFLRHNSTEFNPTPSSGYTTEHGIDNWRVWVCKGTPPVGPVTVLQDDFSGTTDPLVRWDTTYTRTGAVNVTLDNPTNPGNPGGYRRGRHEFPAGNGSVNVTHLFKTPFDPAGPNGPVARLDVTMDRRVDPGSTPGAAVGSLFVVSQNGVTYTASVEPANNAFSNTLWERVKKSLTAADFLPAPGPNFSAGVMRFGFIRSNTSGGGVTVVWGTDNWAVEIYR